MKHVKKFFLLVVIPFALFIIIFSILPIYNSFGKIFSAHNLVNLEYARNYYTTLSQVVTIFASFAGLFLGYYYFMSKVEHDKEVRILQRKKIQIENLLLQLDNFEKVIFEILLTDKANRELLRWKVRSIFGRVVSILEENASILDFTDDENKIILKVNSYVDKNEYIMGGRNIKYEETQQKNKIIEEFYEFFFEAEKVCVRHLGRDLN